MNNTLLYFNINLNNVLHGLKKACVKVIVSKTNNISKNGTLSSICNTKLNNFFTPIVLHRKENLSYGNL